MRKLPMFAFRGVVLTPQECDRIIALAEAATLRDGTVDDTTTVNMKARNSSITFVPQPDGAWIYDKVIGLSLQSNRELWNFQLDGAEPMQIARYESGQHYVGHVDIGLEEPLSLRKLSVVIQLSDPADYDGGELVLYSSGESTEIAPRERGAMTVFPSYTLHQVKPVIRGRRYSLAHWIIGREPFR